MLVVDRVVHSYWDSMVYMVAKAQLQHSRVVVAGTFFSRALTSTRSLVVVSRENLAFAAGKVAI